MARTRQVNQWIKTLSSNLPHLTRSQATVLALWSFAAVVLHTCALTSVAFFLAELEDQPPNTVRQRLKEFYKQHHQKKGEKRLQLDVSGSFVPLLHWILRLWQGSAIALALDATLVGQRWVALVISVVYRGNALPVAWCILPANTKGAWKPHWLALLAKLEGAFPTEMTVLMLTDRGLYAPWLYRAIEERAWHPFMRINSNGKFCPKGSQDWYGLKQIVTRPGQGYRGAGTMFKTKDRRLVCTLVACWEPGYDQAWFIVTDLAPTECEAAWYGLRTWIEQGFKCIKSSGFQWQHTRLAEAVRLERLWLVYAVGMLWMVSVGGSLELEQERGLYGAAVVLVGMSVPAKRCLRLFRRGIIRILVCLIRGRRLPMPKRLVPEAWPRSARESELPHAFETQRLAA